MQLKARSVKNFEFPVENPVEHFETSTLTAIALDVKSIDLIHVVLLSFHFVMCQAMFLIRSCPSTTTENIKINPLNRSTDGIRINPDKGIKEFSAHPPHKWKRESFAPFTYIYVLRW
jgi:hypothetical protein